MKVHYINILLFALPLNILEHNQWNHYMKPHTYTNRSLCKCELYAPANYDNDPQMKSVMQQFEDRTSQRFHEYDDRMIEKRKQCKDRCDKEIQKIILKDKLEKQMAQHFDTLHTDIQRDAIPTCICEKSLADKVEKVCLKCAQNFGGIVAPSSGVIGEIAALSVNAWKDAAIAAATAAAQEAGMAFGKIVSEVAVTAKVVELVKSTFGVPTLGGKDLGSYFATTRYTNFPFIIESINFHYEATCIKAGEQSNSLLCFLVENAARSPGKASSARTVIGANLRSIVARAEKAAAKAAKDSSEIVSTAITSQETRVIDATYMGYQTAIIASIVAIVVIVLIMVIIYLILRYRRKKKMKKKLQYTKLLNE
ncbi:rifin [Plasmodium reichenowi]|uniref:Rifin n=1 Tax=Plasmodium reichenowi TaxID=5854 RepID=A0A060RQK7_PLARE|nr:rifin [Plasmodium reichenowi]